MRLTRSIQTLTLAFVLIAMVAPSARGGGSSVDMANDAFDPPEVMTWPGHIVSWTNGGTEFYDTVSDETNPDGSEGLALWASPQLLPTERFEWEFISAGIYHYHDSTHEGMTGSVVVPVEVEPDLGGEGTAFTITVASIEALEGFVYDVQKRDPGGSFRPWKTGITRPILVFRPPSSGVYSFRARLRRTDTGGMSLYSPARSITYMSDTHVVRVAHQSFTPDEMHAKLGNRVYWAIDHGDHTATSRSTNPGGWRRGVVGLRPPGARGGIHLAIHGRRRVPLRVPGPSRDEGDDLGAGEGLASLG